MDIQQVIQAAAQDPRFNSALQAAQSELSDASPDQIEELIRLFELMLKRPKDYAQIVETAVRDDMIEAGDLPEQFDATIIASLLVVLYKLREGGGQAATFARGGLTGVRTLARQGRFGDTMLAHISPEEAALLKARGGAGTINPETGLPQYFSLKKLFKAVLPIAISFIAPGLGSAIGSAILGAGASAAATAALGGAIIGGVSSGLTGGNVLQGALMGGLGGGLGGMAGKAASDTLGLGLGQTGQAVLGGALVGGVAGAATGQGFAKGALQGAVGSGIGELAGGASGPTAFQQGVSAAGKTFGQALTAGYDPKTAVMAGGLSGLATGLTYKPSDAVVENMQKGEAGGSQQPSQIKLPSGEMSSNVPGTTGTNAAGQSGTYVVNPQTGSIEFKVNPGSYQFNPQTNAVEWKPTEAGFWDKALAGGPLAGQPQTAGGQAAAQQPGGMGTLSKLALGATALSALSSAPPQIQEAVSTLSPEQQEYFNRPSIAWDWDKLQRDANSSNLSLNQFMSRNWNNIAAGNYNLQVAQKQPVVEKAQGGALNALARFARGAGSGRDDTINARLSDGEYVMDAETVAMLGDGSSEDGARKLDAMRSQLRKHKGKALAKGKFSPNAKSPLAYIKGVA